LAKVDAPQGCPVIAGAFHADYTLLETQGNCARAKATSTDPMKFIDGSFVSPVTGLIKCLTTQSDCALSVICTTLVISARMDFAGTLSQDGAMLTGTAVLKGTYDGCSSLSYDVSALLDPVKAPGAE
jgi:hypothetical protein